MEAERHPLGPPEDSVREEAAEPEHEPDALSACELHSKVSRHG
jgi:hypothetical protein